mmetsp:Transcript_69066/g.200408  ORF Transcript_69066/g.200408 Transcript_69066/m.200408 type:complete len:208 (-) Transcript_69066:47-670(-)
MENERNHMRLASINMHLKLGVVSVQSKSIGTPCCKFRIRPSFHIWLHFMKDSIGHIRSINKPGWFRRINHIDFLFGSGSFLESLTNGFAKVLHQTIWCSGQRKSEFCEIWRHDSHLHCLRPALKSLSSIRNLCYLIHSVFLQSPPPSSVWHHVLQRISVVPSMIASDSFFFGSSQNQCCSTQNEEKQLKERLHLISFNGPISTKKEQ